MQGSQGYLKTWHMNIVMEYGTFMGFITQSLHFARCVLRCLPFISVFFFFRKSVFPNYYREIYRNKI